MNIQAGIPEICRRNGKFPQDGKPPGIDLHQAQIGRSVGVGMDGAWIEPAFRCGDGLQEYWSDAISLTGRRKARG